MRRVLAVLRPLLRVLPFAAVATVAGAQADPTREWRTLRTEHFRVHFTPELEEHARRAAANAERAWAGLARELRPPRGPVDLVIADNVDFTNGYATFFPANRITVFTHPPVDTRSLRFYDDWSALVVTHELTHVFHLDRTRGWWRGAQRVFGRNPLLFPNAYAPGWLTEGLAVYYESRLTGSGRLAGTGHRMLARATARAGGVPRLDELSLATSRYPGGEAAYAYGSLLFEHLARTQGAERVPAFVERTSGAPLPFLSNVSARRAFGLSFADAWREFRDSVVRAERADTSLHLPLPEWRPRTAAGRAASYPRWVDNKSVLFGAATGRETPGVYLVGPDAGPRRLGRRNGVDPNTRLADGSLVYTQVDYVNAQTLRSDLWIQRGGRERRLTSGARLSAAHARPDGGVVAVQAVPGGTRLVVIPPSGGAVRPITAGGADEQWAEPRWSPGGARIAAVRWSRGGVTSLVVLDTTGLVLNTLASARAVNASPSWTADGRALVFASDRSGSAQLWLAALDGAEPRLLSDDATGIFEPDVSPDGARLTATVYRATGEIVGVGSLRPELSRAGAALPTLPDPAPAERVETPAGPYRAWRGLVPRYWMPLLGTGADGGVALGAATSASDAIGRHAWYAQGLWDLDRSHLGASGSYQFLGLRQPVLALGFLQDWSYFQEPFQAIGERTRIGSMSATFRRPRARTFSSLTFGGEFERVDYDAPASLVSANPQLGEHFDYLVGAVSGAFSNTQRPALSISPEDGISLSATVRQLWRRSTPGGESRALSGTARAYKSLDLPGFAHHVIALRASAGVTDRRTRTLYRVGGTGGGPLEIFPGVVLGDAPRTFAVRGYQASAQRGTHALGGTAEWRAPLVAPSRGLGLVPAFVDRASLAVFSDAGVAWCTGASDVGGCGPRSTPDDRWLVSAGAEVVVDFALQYDVPYRGRLGVGVPLTQRELARRSATLYLTFGSAF